MAAFGPVAAAKIEASKAFAHETWMRQGARQNQPDLDNEPGNHHLETGDLPVVIKADGLAAGKGGDSSNQTRGFGY